MRFFADSRVYRNGGFMRILVQKQGVFADKNVIWFVFFAKFAPGNIF
jgi:hypothetical protein